MTKITYGDCGYLVTEAAGAVYGSFGSLRAAQDFTRLLATQDLVTSDRDYVKAMRLGA